MVRVAFVTGAAVAAAGDSAVGVLVLLWVAGTGSGWAAGSVVVAGAASAGAGCASWASTGVESARAAAIAVVALIRGYGVVIMKDNGVESRKPHDYRLAEPVHGRPV